MGMRISFLMTCCVSLGCAGLPAIAQDIKQYPGSR
jgi:hypothetical protein